MNVQSAFEFQWGSPLGIAVALFLVCSAVYVLIAIAGAVITHKYGVAAPQTYGGFVFSAQADTVFFGRPPAEVVKENPMLGKLILVWIDFMCGFMLGFGILLFGVVWFGLRQGQQWALWIAVAGNVAMLIYYWFLAVLPFMRTHGFGYAEIWHPFAAIATVLVPIAAVLGWMGLP